MKLQIFALALFLASCAGPSLGANATGSWTITLSTDEGTIKGVASLEQVGDDVSGTLGPPGDPTVPVKGVVTGNKLTLQLYPQPGRTTAFDKADVTVGENEMIGTIDRHGATHNGTIKFVRTAP